MKAAMALHVASSTVVSVIFAAWCGAHVEPEFRGIVSYVTFLSMMWILWACMEYPRRP